MPRQQEIIESYWTVCWKWIIPYPCEKSKTVTKWCYDFSFLNVSYRFFYTNYWGCEGTKLYFWRSWKPTFKIEDFTLYFYTKCFKNLLKEKGPCGPTDVVVFVGGILEDFIKSKVKEVLMEQESDRKKNP